MNTSIKQRLQGTLVAMVVALTAFAVGAAPASAAQAAGNAGSATAGISALTKAQKKAKAKALKKCKKTKKAKKRKACIKKVNKKYNKIAAKQAKPKGKTHRVAVLDDYYSPGDLTIKANDWLLWDWKGVAGSEPHNVSLGSAPAGVSPRGFESDLTSSTTYTFKRQLTKPGNYTFFCSLHTLMTMNVKVTK